MKSLLCIIIMFNVGIVFAQSENTILEAVNYDVILKKMNHSKKGTKYSNSLFHKIVQTDSLNRFRDSDKLFVLDTYDVETGITYFAIWDNKSYVNIEINKEEISFQPMPILDEKIKQLITDWDIVRLKKLEKKYASLISPYYYRILRVVFHDGKAVIDAVSFNEFHAYP